MGLKTTGLKTVPDPEIRGNISPRPTPECLKRVKGLLLEVEYTPEKLGRYSRTVRWHKKAYTETVICCFSCFRSPVMFFMLWDETWARVAGKDDVLCFDCTEARLGRKIVSSDLNNASVNEELRKILVDREK